MKTHKIKCEQKQGGEGAAEMLPQVSRATVSLICRCCQPQL